MRSKGVLNKNNKNTNPDPRIQTHKLKKKIKKKKPRNIFDWRKSLNLGDRCDHCGIDLNSIGEVDDLGGADLTRGRERVSDWLKKTRNDAVACESRPSGQASNGVQVVTGGGGENTLQSGEGDSRRGVERTADEVSGDGLRWYPWPVLWSHRALSDRRKCSRYQLSLYGWLCRSVWHNF